MREEKKTILRVKISESGKKIGVRNFEVLTSKGLKLKINGAFCCLKMSLLV